MLVYDAEARETRVADTDDEDEDGDLQKHLHWVNPMIPLALEDGFMDDEDWPFHGGRPLQIVISFLLPLCLTALVLPHP